MTEQLPETKDEVVLSPFDILGAVIVAPLMIAYAAYSLFKAEYAIGRSDMDAGFAFMYASVFLNIAALCIYKNIKFITIYFWLTLSLYTAFVIYLVTDLAVNGDALIFFGFIELTILVIYGIYYLIKIKSRTNEKKMPC